MNPKIKIAFCFVVCILPFLTLEAARGGGGGARGGGGRIGGSPSMSRAGAGSFGATPDRAQYRDSARQFMQQSPLSNQPLGQNRQNLQNIANNQPNAGQLSNVRNQIQANNPQLGNVADIARARNAAANWYGINGWVGGDWNDPIYYDYPTTSTSAVPVVINNYNAPQQPVVQTAAPTVQTTLAGAQEVWTPIGTYAAAKDVEQAPYSNMFVTLSLNKAGDITGSYYNGGTKETKPLDGAIDKQTQVAAWWLSDNQNSPILQTGLYNLTQETTPVQVHFQDGTMQVWYLVKLSS